MAIAMLLVMFPIVIGTVETALVSQANVSVLLAIWLIQVSIQIVNTFLFKKKRSNYLLCYLGLKTAKGPFGLRVRLPYVYHTRWRLRTVLFYC